MELLRHSKRTFSSRSLLLSAFLVTVGVAITWCDAQADGKTIIPFWQQTTATGIVTSAPLAGSSRVAADYETRLWREATTIPTLSQATVGDGADRVTNKDALKRALMSAVIPGTGQLRNGSLLRGIGYMAIEVGEWIAFTSFKNGIDNKTSELGRFANNYWFIDQYREGAYSSGCSYDSESDSLVTQAMDFNRSRFYDYLAREEYSCGWDTTRVESGATDDMSDAERNAFYKDLRKNHFGKYVNIWDDREDLRSAKSTTGRLIFFNHLISAVDAFIEARKLRVPVGEFGEVKLDLNSNLKEVNPKLVYVHHF
jgi:hypothetical protein